MNKPTALYVHIPFCQHLCPYCDFTKMQYHAELADQYLTMLAAELAFYHPQNLTTIYVGGGTPTALSDPQFRRLLTLLAPYTTGVREYSLEANVENLTSEKVAMLKAFGVNRLSLGVQSFDQNVLLRAGRHHSAEDVTRVVATCREAGITNISIDLIYGLPGQTLAVWVADVAQALALNLPHLSAYSLNVEANTPFFTRGISAPLPDESRQYYDYLLQAARSAGYQRYEISSFARPGFTALHNLVYWHNEQYYAVGIGASGYIGTTRYRNTTNLKSYLRGTTKAEVEELDAATIEQEYVMLHLRLADGFSRADYQARFGVDFAERYQNSLPKLIDYGLLVVDEKRVFPTDEGIMKLNYLLVHLE